MQKTKKLKCAKCGHMIGNVSIRPAFKRQLLMYSLVIAFGFELVANTIANLFLKVIGL